MRILMISSLFYPKIDGSVRVVHDLSRKLVQHGHEVYLLTRRLPKTPKYEDFDKIHVIRVDSFTASPLSRTLVGLKQGLEAVKFLRSRHFDVVHSHGCVPALAGVISKYLAKVPLVVTFHGHQVLWPKSVRWKKGISIASEVLLEKITLKKADIIIAQSAEIKDFFVRMYGATLGDKTKIVPNGVDMDKFNISSLLIQRKAKHPLILSVGMLSRRKGQDVLIKAVPKILKVQPQAEFVIVGGGPQRMRLTALSRQLGVKKHVTFAGPVTDEQLKEYYSRADIVVLTSIEEFFGLVLLEGMAMGKPVVATNVMGPRNIIKDGENGILVDPRNPEQLADAIINLLFNEELTRKISMKGRREIEEKYSLEIVVKRHEELYMSLKKRK